MNFPPRARGVPLWLRFAVVCSLFGLPTAEAQESDSRPEIAVFRVETLTPIPGVTDDDKKRLGLILESDFIASDQFRKVHTQDEILRAIKQVDECNTDRCEAKLAGAIGADQYVKALVSYVRRSEPCVVEVRIQSTAEGVIRNGSENGPCSPEGLEGALHTAISRVLAGRKVAAMTDALGSIVVSSSVEDSDMYIDGNTQPQRVGRRPVSIAFNRPGTHEVKVAKNGYLEHVETVTLVAGKTVRVFAELVKDQPAPAPSMSGAVSTLLTVVTTPAGAVVTIDGVPAHRSPMTQTVEPGKHVIVATLELHHPKRVEVALAAGQNLKVELQLDPNFGRLVVDTAPLSDVMVQLDGRQMGVASPQLTRPRVRSGTYQLRLSKADYKDHVQDVTIRDGRETRVAVASLQSAVGSLSINSAPDRAQVTLDGRLLGTTPTSAGRLASGTHLIELSLPHHESASRTVSVREGATESVTITLEPRYASMSISSTPENASAFIDDTPVGPTPANVPVVDEGEHSIVVLGREGAYQRWRETVRVVRGQPLQVQAVLTPIHGRLVVITDPPDATFRLDGEVRGQTPSIVDPILGGAHQFTLSLAGHREISKTINVEGNRETAINLPLLALLPQEVAEQKRAEWENETSGRRWAYYCALAGTAALGIATAVAAVETVSTGKSRDAAYDKYRALVGSPPDQVASAYTDYQSKNSTANVWLGATIGLASATAVGIVSTILLNRRIPDAPRYEIVATFSPSGPALVGATFYW